MSNGQPIAKHNSVIEFMNWNFQTGEIRFIPPADIKTEFESELLKIVPDMSVEASTPQGQLVTLLTNVMLTVLDNYQLITNTLFFGGSGSTLDNWAFNNYRVTRRHEERGSVSIVISGTPNTVVESTEQNRFKVSDGILTFELLNNVIIDEGGQVTADFVCTEFSTKVAKAGEVIQIATPRVNVERVENPSVSTPGVPAENDHSLYLRCVTYGSVYNNSSFRSMVSNMYQTYGVLKINAKENIGSVPLQYKGVQIPAHGVAFVILGGTAQDIANTFLSYKTPGTAMAGDQDAVTYYQNHKVTYKYFRPSEVPLKVEIDVHTTIDMPSNYEDILKDKLVEFIDKQDIGSVISQPMITCSINNLGLVLKDVKLSKKSETPSYNAVDLQFKEMATLDREDITIKKT